MSTTQKIIKNLALALAFFLIITIFGTIAFVFNLIGNIFFNFQSTHNINIFF